jgi:2-polyprenyl-6-hydroxyphenyl methylase/3-demethylubiquinone-9 3-methyltransferase
MIESEPGSATPTVDASGEIDRGQRFAFGENWSRFLRVLTPLRIEQAERSLQALFREQDLRGRSLVDVGSGSGLFSLAARRLGARVHSFDYDPMSVACAEELRRRFRPEDPDWRIEQGSVLDLHYLRGLGRFEIVYSWGVLHHTGAMWAAVGNAASLVADDGQLVIALYNRQPVGTPFWRAIKRLYLRLPAAVRPVLVVPFFLWFAALGLGADLVLGRSPLARWRGARDRGMSMYRDTVDWLGGWPFEVASPAEVVEFCRAKGFLLERIVTVGGRHGCNQFVFRRLRP